jgi:hypothetical protein
MMRRLEELTADYWREETRIDGSAEPNRYELVAVATMMSAYG